MHRDRTKLKESLENSIHVRNKRVLLKWAGLESCESVFYIRSRLCFSLKTRTNPYDWRPYITSTLTDHNNSRLRPQLVENSNYISVKIVTLSNRDMSRGFSRVLALLNAYYKSVWKRSQQVKQD